MWGQGSSRWSHLLSPLAATLCQSQLQKWQKSKGTFFLLCRKSFFKRICCFQRKRKKKKKRHGLKRIKKNPYQGELYSSTHQNANFLTCSTIILVMVGSASYTFQMWGNNRKIAMWGLDLGSVYVCLQHSFPSRFPTFIIMKLWIMKTKNPKNED